MWKSAAVEGARGAAPALFFTRVVLVSEYLVNID